MKKFIMFILGTILVGLGVALIILTNVGAGSWDAFTANLSSTFGLTVGTWLTIVSVVLVIIASFIDKKSHLLSIFVGFGIGLVIDFCLLNLGPHIDVSSTLNRYVLFAISIYTLSLGIAFQIKSKFPVSPIELLPLSLTNKSTLDYPKSKTVIEAVALIGAISIGFIGGYGLGQVSIGTLITALTIGPLINTNMNLLGKVKNN